MQLYFCDLPFCRDRCVSFLLELNLIPTFDFCLQLGFGYLFLGVQDRRLLF